MQQVMVQISGISPLLMHNRRLSDPTDRFVKEIRAITSKPSRQKTEEDHLQIMKLEFLGGLYFTEKDGVYIPSENIEAAIRDGARTIRKGMTVEKGVQVQGDRVPLAYDGPRKAEQLFDAGFYDYRRVGVNRGSSTMRTRPYFTTWGCTFTLEIEIEIISVEDLRRCVDLAGRAGLGDFRPRYGKFQVEEWVVS